jgi:hypothetical protein
MPIQTHGGGGGDSTSIECSISIAPHSYRCEREEEWIQRQPSAGYQHPRRRTRRGEREEEEVEEAGAKEEG